MKTAVSLPDALFRAAEQHAGRTRKSRSQLYAEALSEYLTRHAPDEVTDAMNQVVDQLAGGHQGGDEFGSVAGFGSSAARRVFARSEW